MMFFKKSKTDNEIANVLKETASLLSQINNNIKPKEVEKPHTEEEKRRAAYALNLCMVSISQIIDYNDINILEQEYDGILNNLNLEKMPKDEALLNILKQILDTITFFRIQEGDRKFVEMEYQQRMKQAIWSAVPNFGMIISTNNPATMVLSIATQVGIGYMNYRKEKASTGLDKMKAEWQLQRSAMEQFNGLRRELFDTAWRLADEYGFPDNFRLTERQIKQYNDILMDENVLRRYERLDSIKENFEAYPPFWYFFGHTAALIFFDYSDFSEISENYKKLAKEHFETYFKYNKNNTLLREDEINASCALEYVDLLVEENDKNKIEEYIKQAVKSSGGKNDVLQLCALAYMKTGSKFEAIKLLRILVNEEYNATINAQLLSNMYVSEYIQGNKEAKHKYDTLCNLVDRSYLYPMPKKEEFKSPEEIQYWEKHFVNLQKKKLLETLALTFDAFYKKNCTEYNELNSVQSKLDMLNTVFSEIEAFPCVSIEDMHVFYNETVKLLKDNKDYYLKGFRSEEMSAHEKEKCNFETIICEPYKKIFQIVVNNVKDTANTMQDLSVIETQLAIFNHNNRLHIMFADAKQQDNESIGFGIYNRSLLEEPEDTERTNKYNEMMNIIKDYSSEKLIENTNGFKFIKRGETDFESYCRRRIKGKYITKYYMAVLNDTTISDFDIIFSVSGIRTRSRFPWQNGFISYSSVKISEKKDKLKLGDKSYSTKGLNHEEFWQLIERLKRIEESYDSSKTKGVGLSFYTESINKLWGNECDNEELFNSNGEAFYAEPNAELMVCDNPTKNELYLRTINALKQREKSLEKTVNQQ